MTAASSYARSGLRDDTAADENLVDAAIAGDPRALERLLERHTDRLYAVCLRVLGDREDALDATQESLIAITRGLVRFDRRARFTTWSYRVATNAALDVARRRQRAPVPTETLTEPVSGEASVDEHVAARIDVHEALAAVPLEFRVAIVLRDGCDLAYSEIAEILDVPVGTVRSRIARGRRALAAQLGNQPEGVERPRSEP